MCSTFEAYEVFSEMKGFHSRVLVDQACRIMNVAEEA
jgi:hypothetical protein